MRARQTLLKEKYVSVKAMKRGYGYGCVYVCVIINQISSRQLLVCVCYQSTPGKAVNARTRCVCVRAHARLRVGMSVCMRVCPASSLSRQQLLVYLFHQYAKSLLSADGRIADCTVRHPGVERLFSSSYFLL